VTEEWEIDRLDLDAYLHRIGHHGQLTAPGQTLTALHRAHIAAIPFENLDIVLGCGVSVDLPSVQAKLVDRRRGGYCYEHGVLFAAVLQRLGYTVDRLLARVGADKQRPRPRSHMTLHVQADGQQWLADVGFGAGLLEPLPWGDTGPHQQGGWTYQLVPDGADHWQLHELTGDDWTAQYSFTAEPQHAADVEVANHYTSTHPSSPFTGQLIVMRKDANARRRLIGRQLTIARPDGSTHEQQLTNAEIADALHSNFGLPLTPQEVLELTATLPDYATTP
jgi:N-hydroxyarylamine O-acetyltransferase